MEEKSPTSPLHTVKPASHALFNRLSAAVYACAIITLLYHHLKTLIFSQTLLSFSITISMLLSDLILAFMWLNTRSLCLYPIKRKQFPENLQNVLKTSELPGLDIFICTADPYKEPPIDVVSTALSVMAYEYPTEKISIYVSDDGGSEVTLFAFMEAAKFATHWLPFCKKNKVVVRSPEAYFESNTDWSHETEELKMMYMNMKIKIENVLERGKVDDCYIIGDAQRQAAFNKWNQTTFTRQDHPTVIQVLLESSKDRDVTGQVMPNLIYVSREKSKNVPHRFKAGALNVLLRVSATMTNAPVILTLDCDMYSNDPETPLRALCYLCDPAIRSTTGYVQFPQKFKGLNKNDIYAAAYEHLFQIHPAGFDGLRGPNHVGTGCFFNRRTFFGGPSCLEVPEIPELRPDHVVDNPIRFEAVSDLAHRVAGCTYENDEWGSKLGFRYGSLVEDYYTGYRLTCEGWQSIFCNPERPAFMGDAPISLIDLMNQQKRWSIGLLEVSFSKYCPLTYGAKSMGLMMGLGYAQLSFWSFWSIPVVTYAFLPQLALLNKIYIFPATSEPWFLLYVFLFLGAYGQDLLEFVCFGTTAKRWWNDQRIWLIRGLTCHLFGFIEYTLKSLKISTHGFKVTSKVMDEEQSKRYNQGMFEFGVHSPMFVTLSMAAIINLVALLQGLFEVLRGNNVDRLLFQLLVSGFAVINCWPIYEAMVLRSDKGKMPIRTTVIAIALCLVLYTASSFVMV